MTVGWIAGIVWSGANLIFLKKLAVLLSSSTPNRRALIILLLVKFAGLYPLGIWILSSGIVSLGAFAAGFTAILFGAACYPSFVRTANV